MAKKTILMYVLQWVNARNMLRCGVLDELKSASPDVRVVVVSPLGSNPRFVDEFADTNVVIEAWPQYELRALQQRLTSLAIERFVRMRPTNGVRLRWRRQENVKAQRNRGAAILMKAAMGSLPISPWALLRMSDALVPASAYEPLLRRYSPDLVVSGTAWQITETPWYVGPKRHGIPSVAIDINWDAFESKPGIVRGADELLVWGPRQREKAITRFGYAPGVVHVTGAPQFDRYFRLDELAPRDEFMRRLGFPPDSRLITLAAVASFNSPHDPARLELLYEAVQRGDFGPSCAILVRLHPVDSLERWRRFQGLPGVRIEMPFGEGPEGGSLELGESKRDLQHQAETLVHTDVLVNVNSTISFEAMLVDTPVVMVAFDGRGEHLPYLRSDARFLAYDHMRALVETGGISIARSAESFVAAIKRYLEDRSADRAERKRAAESLYGPPDGRAAIRIADHLWRLAVREKCACAPDAGDSPPLSGRALTPGYSQKP